MADRYTSSAQLLSKVLGLEKRAQRPLPAWHASPHNFDKFDLDKIGTGQGAASYGHGIYAAESPQVSGPLGSYDMEFTAKRLRDDPRISATGIHDAGSQPQPGFRRMLPASSDWRVIQSGSTSRIRLVSHGRGRLC